MPVLVLPLRQGAQLDLFAVASPAPEVPRTRPLHERPDLALLPTPSGVRRWQHLAPPPGATPAQTTAAIHQLLQHADAHPDDLTAALAALPRKKNEDPAHTALRGEVHKRLHALRGDEPRERADRRLPPPPAPATPDFLAELPREKEKQQAARRKGRPHHFPDYAPHGAPAQGERGYVGDEPLPPGALDGDSPAQVAAHALAGVRNLLQDYSLLWGLKHLEERALFGYDEGVDLSDLEDDWPGNWPPGPVDSWADIVRMIQNAVGLPRNGPDGKPWRGSEREAVEVEAWKLGLETTNWDLVEDNFSGLERSPLVPERFRDEDDTAPIPTWLAEAVLADRIDPRQKLRIVNVSKKEAARFIAQHHSALPYLNPKGLLYCIGLMRGERLVAVATANTPTGNHRKRDSDSIVDLTRIASDGTVKGASSKLAARILDLLPRSNRAEPGKPALFITYSLTHEEGSTYKALREKGLRPVAIEKGKAATTGSRKGADASASKADTDKIVWEAGPGAREAKWDLLGSASEAGVG